MFDIGWSEILIIAVVAIIVVGPKDLPRMLRTLGKTLGQVRRTANDFRRQFDDAIREAEQQADFDETRKSLEGLGKIDPLGDVKKELESVTGIGSDIKAAVEKTTGKPKAGNSKAKTAPAVKDAKTAPAEKKVVAKKATAKKASKPAAKPKTARSKPAPAKSAGSKKTKPAQAKQAAGAQSPVDGSDAV